MQNAREKYLPWLTLREIPFVGNVIYKKLIDHFQTPDRVLAASKDTLEKTGFLSSRVIKGILNHDRAKQAAARELDLIIKKRVRIVTLTDRHYPALLRHIPDPPPLLTHAGNIDNQTPCISIVGSRKPTSYGMTAARRLAAGLADKGFQIVSGMARGIDTMAHKAALSVNARTLAVLGSGLDRIYPAENYRLFQVIREKGSVFSEFKIQTQPAAHNFPLRNRVIAGMSCGTIVIEAAEKSGSLITARFALEYNRELFAVPGSIFSPKSRGTHALIRQGAKLVENETDIINELHHFVHAEKKEKPGKKTVLQKKTKTCTDLSIIKFLDPYPVHIDILIEKSGLSPSEVMSQLTDLDLSGKIRRHQGDYYSLTEDTIE